jgi:hypothetical protein
VIERSTMGVLPVEVAQAGAGGPVTAGLAQQRVVFVQIEGAAGLRGGAAQRQRQPRQAAPKVTVRRTVIGRVSPFGQRIVPACSSTVKSSMVNPPGTAGRSGAGLITAM